MLGIQYLQACFVVYLSCVVVLADLWCNVAASECFIDICAKNEVNALC